MAKAQTSVAADRRSMRTRAALSFALIELIAERGWDDIAVQDVCQRADVGRTTFYLHYPNKDALLQGGLDGLQAQLRRQAQAGADAAHPDAGPPAGFHFIPGLIDHAHEQRQVFRGLIGRRSGHVVQQRFREMVIRLISDELPESGGNLPRAALARWLAGAFVELLSWWVEQGTQIPPPDLAREFDVLARPVWEQARQKS